MSKRSEAFFEYKCEKQKDRIKQLERECADLQVKNQELAERCKKLASRTPEWLLKVLDQEGKHHLGEQVKLRQLDMELFGGCNYSCSMCPQGSEKGREPEI